MRPLRSIAASRRPVAIVAGVLCLLAVATPAQATGNPPSVHDAQQGVNQARNAAHSADTALGTAQAALAAAQSRLAAIQTKVNAVKAEIAADRAKVLALKAQALAARRALAEFLRQSYAEGPNPGLDYVLAGGSINDIMQRSADEERLRNHGRTLVEQVKNAEAGAENALADAQTKGKALAVLEAQAVTAAAVLSIQQQNAAVAASAARGTLSQSLKTLHDAQAAAAAAAPPPPPPVPPSNGGGGITFHPVSGTTFTIDTDLTQPSGMTAAEIDSFLAGTSLQGLGASYIHAEQTYHVSARYFVAHSILESGWGTSAIAQDKHNLFGFGADDANPYGDAMTFDSFDSCIQFVAHFISTYYLTPGGRFYHGSTLRGMNVVYASDPLWASKIARIANTIP